MRGLTVTCETDASVEELSPGAALCLYRIAQEALGNAAKYSAAQKVEVRLTRSDGRVRLVVSDDGVGYHPRADLQNGKGYGVINMRERVLQLNGKFEFDSKAEDNKHGEGGSSFSTGVLSLPQAFHLTYAQIHGSRRSSLPNLVARGYPDGDALKPRRSLRARRIRRSRSIAGPSENRVFRSVLMRRFYA